MDVDGTFFEADGFIITSFVVCRSFMSLRAGRKVETLVVVSSNSLLLMWQPWNYGLQWTWMGRSLRLTALLSPRLWFVARLCPYVLDERSSQFAFVHVATVELWASMDVDGTFFETDGVIITSFVVCRSFMSLRAGRKVETLVVVSSNSLLSMWQPWNYGLRWTWMGRSLRLTALLSASLWFVKYFGLKVRGERSSVL
ncbi:hypothetical protein J6590_081480 [Homalodisca vitripennis]|nr:hypothetical protein J6590_081480 [Homalodisca vitripennis]